LVAPRDNATADRKEFREMQEMNKGCAKKRSRDHAKEGHRKRPSQNGAEKGPWATQGNAAGNERKQKNPTPPTTGPHNPQRKRSSWTHASEVWNSNSVEKIKLASFLY